jgi:hypothetical protein
MSAGNVTAAARSSQDAVLGEPAGAAEQLSVDGGRWSCCAVSELVGRAMVSATMARARGSRSVIARR